MHRAIRLTVMVLVSACAVRAPRPIAATELAIRGIGAGADSATVTRRLGPPDSVGFARNYHHVAQLPDSTRLELYYPGITFQFRSQGQLAAVAVTGRSVRAIRGLRIGDDTSRVRARLGAPVRSNASSWWYEPEPGVVLVLSSHGKVLGIIVGHEAVPVPPNDGW